MIDPQLLEVLANPCHPDRPPLKLVGSYLVCTVTGDGFPIRDGIPQLLPEDRIPAEQMAELTEEPNHE